MRRPQRSAYDRLIDRGILLTGHGFDLRRLRMLLMRAA
jgi:hypothetical protein